MTRAGDGTARSAAPATVSGQCVCGGVRLEIDYPAFWAWHDHSRGTQHAHGAAYATYIGVWKSRLRIVHGGDRLVRFHDSETRTARSFCATCGTPLFYERPHSPHMVNLPRALFRTRTGREPRYHVGLDESPDWAYRGEPQGNRLNEEASSGAAENAIRSRPHSWRLRQWPHPHARSWTTFRL